MDAFFDELDCRLRVSGMVADSIMMGIVNSAMEDAYKRSCSKEGDIERLIEKSRFCELSIMQLEWCLKYLQEEMDNAVVDSGIDHENMLCDLLETRNRIHSRLEETNVEIANKDIELVRRKENEMKLRLALELKGEEVRSPHDTLWELEKEKSEAFDDSPSRESTNTNENDQHVLDEVGSCVDKQISRVRNKLENGRQALSTLIHSMKTNPRNTSRSFDADNDGTPTLHELHDVTQLMWDLDEVAADIDTLRQEVGSSFETIASSISLFKAATEEEHWIWNTEKEIAALIFSSVLSSNPIPEEESENSNVDLELREEIRKLKEEKNEMEIKARIMDDIYRINLKGPVRGVHAEHSSEINSEFLITESIFRVVFGELFKELIDMRESCISEQVLREDIRCNVFSQVIKDFLCAEKMGNHPMEDNKLLSLKSLQCCKNGGNLEKDRDHSLNSEMVEQENSYDLNNISVADSGEQNRNDSPLRSYSTSSVGKHGVDSDFMVEEAIEKLSQMIGDFELVTCERLRKNILRVDDLIQQSSIFSQHINSIKEKEVLYRKAFICRCYNHQTAEIEVDLLGDQVDTLLNLLKKIYIALDHYSPILQYYSGISEVLNLIRQEIYGDATSAIN